MRLQYHKEILQFAKVVERKFFNNSFASQAEADKINKIKSNNSLYDGFTGILLFLMWFYKIAESSRITVKWANLERELDKLERMNSVQKLNNLYFGKNSVAYLYLQYYLTRGNIEYLKKSINIIKQSEEEIIKDKKNDLVLGKAGNILLCCKIYEVSNNESILLIIKRLTQALIAETKLSTSGGVNWESDINVSRPLTGLSHGNSGIIIALIEASKTLKDQSLLMYAKLAIEYEDSCFNKEVLNWPDFRIDNYYNNENNTITEKLLANKKDLELKSYMNAWCHGAPGVLCARINYLEVFNKKLSNTQISNLIFKIYTETKKLKNNSLCHGISGNVAIIQNITRWIKNENFNGLINDLVDSSLKKFRSDLVKVERQSTDFSLFTGITGVGLMLCTLHNRNTEYAFTLTTSKYETKEKITIKYLEEKYRTRIIKQLLTNHQVNYNHRLIKNLQKKPINYKVILKELKNEMRSSMNSSSIFNYLKLFTIDSKFKIVNNLNFLRFTKIIVDNKGTHVLIKNPEYTILQLNPFVASIKSKDKTYICNQTYFGVDTFIIDNVFYSQLVKFMRKDRNLLELSKLFEIKFPEFTIKEIIKFIVSLIKNRMLIIKF